MAGYTFEAVGHLFHYFGFSMAIGGSIAALKSHKKARTLESDQKLATESVAADIVTKVELPGLFIALLGGVLLVIHNPLVFKASSEDPLAGPGPWLHIKLTLILALFVIAHLKMFRSRKAVRERAAGATESECNALSNKAISFGKICQSLYGAIFLIATFRYVIFRG